MKNTYWIDVSVDLSPQLPTWPGDPALTISKAHNIDKGDAANVTELSLSAHTGTHMDSPYHFINKGLTMSAWQPEFTIGKVKVLEIKDEEFVTAAELKGFDIRENDRILFKTFNSSYEWFTRPFNTSFVCFAEDAAAYLAAKKVQTVGIDYLSVGGMNNGIEVHNHLLGAGIWIIEGLYLGQISAGLFDMICMPVKIKDADGAPCRVLLKSL